MALRFRKVLLEIMTQIKKELSRFFSLELILISLCKSFGDVLFKLILFFYNIFNHVKQFLMLKS